MEKSCCFTGHRPQKLPQTKDNYQGLKTKLKETILSLIHQGYTTYYTGMALGIDLWCGEIVAGLKPEYPELKLVAAIPFAGQSKKFYGENKRLYDDVLKQCSYSAVLSPTYTLSCMQERNKYMVDNSLCVLAVFTGEKGGTKNTINYAKKCGKRVLVLTPGELTVTEIAGQSQLQLL